jgi:hypothetical protein
LLVAPPVQRHGEQARRGWRRCTGTANLIPLTSNEIRDLLAALVLAFTVA